MSLAVPLRAADVRLELLADEYLEGLRAACAADREIWEIYPVSMLDEHFDDALEARKRFHKAEGWIPYIALKGREVVGTTNYIRPDPANGTVEIGGTYLAPHMRGTGFNDIVKRLMIDHAFAEGFRRIEFRIDTRNARSCRAVEKLGAVREGTLRKDRITWTGYARDTAVYGLLAGEWQHEPARLD